MTKEVLIMLAWGQVVIAANALISILFYPVELWIKQLIIIATVTSLLLLAAVNTPSRIKAVAQHILNLLFGNRITSRLIIILLICAGMGGLTTLISRNQYQLPPLWAYLPLILIWPWLVITLLLTIVDEQKHHAAVFVKLLIRLAVSFAIFMVMLEVLLQLFITRLPWVVVGTMPQIQAMQQPRHDQDIPKLPVGEVTYTMNGFTGDLYYSICPSEAAKESPIYAHYMQDTHGFRNPTPWPDRIDLVVVGDSFVAAPAIQHPFWEGVIPSVLEFGTQGIGNTQELTLLRNYGLPRKPKVVVMTYFEGNDITDNWSYYLLHSTGNQDAETFGQPSNSYTVWDYLVTYHLLLWLRDQSGLVANCTNPIRNDQGKSLTFSTYYTSLLSTDTKALSQSNVFAVTKQSIITAANETRAVGATFVLVFIPEKLHAYWDGLVAADQLDHIMSNERVVIPQIVPDRGIVPDTFPRNPHEMAEHLLANIDGQRQLLTQLAADNSFLMLDLTPAFQQAVNNGLDPYFYGDSHWNQKGHDLARKLLIEFLAQHNLLPDLTF